MGGALTNVISALIRRETTSHDFFLCHVRIQQEGSYLWTSKRTFSRNQTGQQGTLIVDFPDSKTVRKKCLFFKPSSQWYFVMAARAESENWKPMFPPDLTSIRDMGSAENLGRWSDFTTQGFALHTSPEDLISLWLPWPRKVSCCYSQFAG